MQETAEQILNSGDYFRCGRQHATMRKEHCVELQREAVLRPFLRRACWDCEQGEEIAEELGETIRRRVKPKTRICAKCGREKPLNEVYFAPHERSRWGLMTYCRECGRENYQAPGVEAEFFRCGRLGETMTKGACLERQDRAENAPDREEHPCRDCEQGEEIADEIGLTQRRKGAEGEDEEDGLTQRRKGAEGEDEEEDGMGDTKVCRKCGREKPLDEFHNDKRLNDGKKNLCKKCTSEYIKGYLRKKRGGSPPPHKAPEGKDVLALDLAHFGDIRRALEARARDELRTVEMQAMIYIKRGVRSEEDPASP